MEKSKLEHPEKSQVQLLVIFKIKLNLGKSQVKLLKEFYVEIIGGIPLRIQVKLLEKSQIELLKKFLVKLLKEFQAEFLGKFQVKLMKES